MLEAEAPLEVAEMRLCKRVHGFGNIEPLESPTRKAGQQVIVLLRDDRARLRARRPRLPLAAGDDRRAARRGVGRPGLEPGARHRRGRLPPPAAATTSSATDSPLPETLAAGNYRLRLTEKDLVADHSATREIPIAITR